MGKIPMTRFSVLRFLTPSLPLALGLSAVVTGPALAGPSDDRILPPDQYKTEKAQQLATTHASALRDLNDSLYHCMPWVEVQKHSIGFFKPKDAPQDDRYLSVRIFVEQDPSPQFAALSVEERASSMFSRYVGPMLRRMSRNQALLNDPTVGGFAVIVEWLKQSPRPVDTRPVHETIATFIERPVVAEYVSGRLPVRQLVTRAKVLGFDGDRPLGQLRLAAWEDDFVATYKVKNHQPVSGVTCR
jgi:hypothetical protein